MLPRRCYKYAEGSARYISRNKALRHTLPLVKAAPRASFFLEFSIGSTMKLEGLSAPRSQLRGVFFLRDPEGWGRPGEGACHRASSAQIPPMGLPRAAPSPKEPRAIQAQELGRLSCGEGLHGLHWGLLGAATAGLMVAVLFFPPLSDLMVEFIVTHMMKEFPMDLYV